MRFNPIHVSDACRPVSAALALEDSCVLNVAGPQVLSFRQAVGLLSTAIGIEPTLDPRAGVAPIDCIGDISTMAARVRPPARALAGTVSELCR